MTALHGVLLRFAGGDLEPIALAGYGDGLGVGEEAVECGVADDLAPVLDETGQGHQRRPVFVPTHDDLEQVFPRSFRGLRLLLPSDVIPRLTPRRCQRRMEGSQTVLDTESAAIAAVN